MPADTGRNASFVEALGRERAVAIIRTREQRLAAEAMEAAIRGGLRIIEFTLTTPGALELVETFARRDGLLVGAGTVLHVEEAEAAARRGAHFLVSPIIDDAVAAAAVRLGLPLIPGASTPTEMWHAQRAGAEVVKLFPAPHDIPTWVRAVRAPMPSLRIIPTQGVDGANARALIEAGCFAVGTGVYLFPPDALADHRWDEVEQRARTLKAAVAAAGSG